MSDLPKILLVEDDLPMALGLEFNLKAEGFSVQHCPDGESGLEEALRGGFSLVVLDMLLPGISGLEVLSGLRQRDQKTPVLILSATASSEAIIEGLDKGADDYMTKPFELEMLLARVRTLLRSRAWLSSTDNPTNSGEQIRVGSRTIDFRASMVTSSDGTVELSFKEGMLLRRDSGARLRERGREPRRAVARRMGIHRRRPDAHHRQFHRGLAQEDRRQSAQAAVHPDGARRGLPFCQELT